MTYLSYMHVQKLMSSLHVGRCLFLPISSGGQTIHSVFLEVQSLLIILFFLSSPSFVITRLRQSFLECKYIRRKECPWYKPSQFFSLTLVQYQLRYQRCNTLHTLIAQVSNRQFSSSFQPRLRFSRSPVPKCKYSSRKECPRYMPFTVSLSTRDTSCVLESQHTPIQVTKITNRDWAIVTTEQVVIIVYIELSLNAPFSPLGHWADDM